MPAAQTKHPIEYRLLIEHAVDDVLKKEGILFLLETAKLFTNFSYQIDVKDDVQENSVTWRLFGLRAPSMKMPETGAAQFGKIYFDVPKTIHFTLVKKDNVQAAITIKFLKSSIKVSDSISNFLKIYTVRDDFERNRFNDMQPPEYKPDMHRAPVVTQQKPKKKKA